jgi:ABC-type Fe3+/spermidine/putrescine transport system ATPase subunit
LAQVGPTDTIFTCPETVEVAKFVGVETIIPGQVAGKEGGLVSVECETIHVLAEGELKPGDRVNVAVRPEAINLLALDDPDAGLAHNAFNGKVTRMVPTETHYRVELDCGMRVVAVIGCARVRELALEVGSRVSATFSSSAAHLIKHNSD